MSEPLYSIGTWDTDEQAYLPLIGGEICVNVPWRRMLAVLRFLRRAHGYNCHRFRDADGSHDDNDWEVLVERTDGKPFDGSR